jgi:hypothetical protein
MNEWLARDPIEPSGSSVEKPPLSPVDRNTSFSTNTHNSRRDLIPEQARHQYMPPSQALAQQSMPSAAAIRSMAGYNNNGGFSPMYDNQQQAVQYQDPSMGYANAPFPAPAQYRGSPPEAQYHNAYAAPAPAVPPPVHVQTPTGSPRVHPAALTPSNLRARQASASVSFALVRNGFVPSLVDELAVGAGEMVRVLEEYDDGWALCANMRGSQGVVPQDVLQRNRASTIGTSGDSAMGAPPPMRNRDDQLAFMPPQSTSMDRPY